MTESPCQPGSYAPNEGRSECLPCKSGYTCPNTTTIEPIPCSTGHYCPTGTRFPSGEPCPVGTYLPTQLSQFRNECLPCPPGQFCGKSGLSNSTGPCLAGYLCKGGAKFSAPNDSVDPFNGPCPAGLYCEEGTTNGTRCPEGTVRPYTGGKSRQDCRPCDGGYYCYETGLITPTEICHEGYYCPAEDDVKVSNPGRFQCPRGYYCPNGTVQPFGCSPGRYQPNTKGVTCDTCPKGRYCPANTSVPLPCPKYHFCPEGTNVPEFCPNGTYTYDNETGLDAADKCRPCDAGYFCQMGIKAGLCSAGYLCYLGNPTPNPDGSNVTIGEPCPIGYYCVEGAINGSECELGLVISKRGAKSKQECGTCPAGKICIPGNPIPVDCNIGHYCPYNQTERACPIRTYCNISGATNITACIPCPAGYLCTQEGNTGTIFHFHLYLLPL